MVEPKILKVCFCCFAAHSEDGYYCNECHDCDGTCDPRETCEDRNYQCCDENWLHPGDIDGPIKNDWKVN